MSPHQAPRGILFDVDGTFYFQPSVRIRMALRLLSDAVFGRIGHPRIKTLRTLLEFRRTREALRVLPPGSGLGNLQYRLVARNLAVSEDFVKEVVTAFMYEKPLSALRAIADARINAALLRLKERGLKLGVYSDYPAARKLEALGIDVRSFDSITDSTMPDIDAFKPNPRGFVFSAKKLGLEPSSVLYVGDGEAVDMGGAIQAGMRGALVTWSSGDTCGDKGYIRIKDIVSLERDWQRLFP